MDFDTTVKNKKKQNKKNLVIALLAVLIILILGLYFCFAKLFFVKSVDIKDNTDKVVFVGEFPYTQEQMLEGLGIKKGIGLYDFDLSEAQSNAKYNLPYIKEIKLSRRWPSTIVAKTVLEAPTYYVSVDNDLYILSDELKVLEKTDSSETIELNTLIHLECKAIHSCIVGEKMGISEDIENIIYELEEKLLENDVQNEITSINVSDKFNISLTYGTRYVVKLGDSGSLGTKIEFMKRIVEDRTGDVVGGTIDVSDEDNREAIYKKFN
ncbi:MAG: FtsQ-type POTRA domain-containing protein [Clostridia bacterium]|nr:FtsQ-type POTRA domain-containing protein [Clostridia bacterium]